MHGPINIRLSLYLLGHKKGLRRSSNEGVPWGDKGNQNKDLFPSKCMSVMRSSSSSDRQTQYVWGRKSSKLTDFSGGKKSISYKFRTDVETCGHRSQYTADKDETETDMYYKKCQVATWKFLLPQQKKGNEILCRVNISPPLSTIAGLNGADQWLSLLGHRNSNQQAFPFGSTLKLWLTRRQLILKRNVMSYLWGRINCQAGSNWLCRCQLCTEVAGRTFEHLL